LLTWPLKRSIMNQEQPELKDKNWLILKLRLKPLQLILSLLKKLLMMLKVSSLKLISNKKLLLPIKKRWLLSIRLTTRWMHSIQRWRLLTQNNKNCNWNSMHFKQLQHVIKQQLMPLRSIWLKMKSKEPLSKVKLPRRRLHSIHFLMVRQREQNKKPLPKEMLKWRHKKPMLLEVRLISNSRSKIWN